jgi:actin-related protein 3
VNGRFAGNDSPSFVFPTAIATRQAPGSSSNRPAPPSKPSFLASGSGGSSGGYLAQKRGTEDLDFFIGDEALQANAGAGYGLDYPIKHGVISDWSLMERYCLYIKTPCF